MDTVRKMLKGDRYIWGIYFILCLVSLVEIYSATSTLTFKLQDYFAPTIRHAMFLLVGTVIVLVIHNLHYRYFKAIPVFLLPLSALLLVYTLVFGEVVNGAQRWISIMGVPLQPSELAKLGVVTAIAYILSKKQEPAGVAKDTFKMILYVVVPACALIFPENFSTAFLLGAVSFCMMLIGRVELKKLFGMIGLMVTIVVLVFVVVPHLPSGVQGLDRAQTWINRITEFSGDEVPEYMQKTDDKNYQVHHARMALANGGVVGKFPGNSRERDFLPQAYSDFIYAIIIEEMGFTGGIFILFLYLSLLIRAGMIAKKCSRTFPAFLIMGIAMMIVFQAIINMAVAVGLMPVTGQPLPLISRGGTSTLITCVYFGMILSISQYAVKEDEEEEAGEETRENPSPNQRESEKINKKERKTPAPETVEA